MKNMKKKVGVALTALAIIGGSLFLSLQAQSTQAEEARECGANSIITCGAMSSDELKAAYAANKNGLVDIYNHYNISATDIANSRSSYTGYVSPDGTVTVNGKVVATGMNTVGRSGSLGGFPVKINDSLTVYQGPSRLKSTLSAYVFFNADGSFKSAVLKVCGNPVPATPVPVPKATCKALNRTPISRTDFTLSATATAENGATISAYVFTVKDASGAVVKTVTVNSTSTSATTPTLSLEAGSYTADVVVKTSLGDKTASLCQTSFTIAPAPVAACTEVKRTVINQTDSTFTASASASNGASISAYVFTVKNASGAVVKTVTVNTTATTATTEAISLGDGSYTVSVVVKTSLGDKTDAKCQTSFTVSPAPVAACTEIKRTQINRTDFTLSAGASAANGASIGSYVFTVKNSAGTVVKTVTVTSTGNTATTPTISLEEGNYTADVVVKTSLGDKTDAKCALSFSIAAAPKPAVTIVKKVDNVEKKTVNVAATYEYEILVTNTGNVTLKNAVVTDKAPEGVTFLSADKGTVSNGSWSYTIASLEPGKAELVKISAKVPTYKAGDIVNKACVDATEMPNTPDACDEATVNVPAPANVSVCDATTGNIIVVTEDKAATYKPANDAACASKQVCELATHTVVTIKGAQYDTKKYSEDVENCVPKPVVKMIDVCRLSDKVWTQIKESDFDETKYSRKEADCKPAPVEQKIDVCRLADKTPTQIVKSDMDESKYSTDMSKCKSETPAPKPEVKGDTTEAPKGTPTTIASTGIESLAGFAGLGSLAGAGYYFRASRKALRNKINR